MLFNKDKKEEMNANCGCDCHSLPIPQTICNCLCSDSPVYHISMVTAINSLQKENQKLKDELSKSKVNIVCSCDCHTLKVEPNIASVSCNICDCQKFSEFLVIKDKNSELEKENFYLRHQVFCLEHNVSSLDDEVKRLEKENAELKQEVESLKTQGNHLQESNNKLANTNIKLQKLNFDLQAKIDSLIEELAKPEKYATSTSVQIGADLLNNNHPKYFCFRCKDTKKIFDYDAYKNYRANLFYIERIDLKKSQEEEYPQFVIPCPDCLNKCTYCHGKGKLRQVLQFPGHQEENLIVCENCNGSGEQPKSTCGVCGGVGKLNSLVKNKSFDSINCFACNGTGDGE